MKKIVSLVLAVCLLIGLVPVSASAAASWSDSYQQFITNKQYKSYSDDVWGNDSELQLSLRDINSDQIPELLLYNAGRWFGSKKTLVFTFSGGKISYIGDAHNINAGADSYSTDSNYPGLFSYCSYGGYGEGKYHYIQNGKMAEATVITDSQTGSTPVKTTETRVTNDNGLYNAYKNRATLARYTISQINRDGWATFLIGCGYSSELSKEDALTRFLTLFAGQGDYNSKKTDALETYDDWKNSAGRPYQDNLLSAMLYHGLPFDYDLYPGDSVDYTSDPLGLYKEYGNSVGRFREDKIKWIMRNILNISEADYLKLRNALEGASTIAPAVYYYDGYYYRATAMGGPGYDIVISNTDKQGDYEIVTYRSRAAYSQDSYSTRYAKMQYKTIGGKQYWSIYYNGKTKPTWPTQFYDVEEDAYYLEPVKWAVSKGVTSGVDSTHFAPNQPCTRAQAVTFLWRAAGSPEPQTTTTAFTDVKAGSYFEKAVRWAVENNVTAGTSPTTFSPNSNCTRGQIVTFMYRAAGSPSISGGNSFSDVPSSQYYANAVAWAVANNITSGTGNGKFSPTNNCTRGQIVTFLYRDAG